ncbi:MAG TPA: hypothetical protein ENL09_06085, partial [Bacteroidetes bacterium]|nr:hypothetical protein [Bacteroidota bacterium]
MAESSNYRLHNDQVNPIIETSESASYKTENKGGAIIGESESANYSAEAGLTFVQTAEEEEAEEEVEMEIFSGSSGYIPPENDPPQVLNLVVTNIGYDKVLIAFHTNELAFGYVKYGQRDGYALQTDSEINFKFHHEFVLTNLSLGTNYNFIINLQDRVGNIARTKPYSVKTPPLIKTVPTATGFKAQVGKNNIVLSWKNPDIKDFSKVKLLRSTKNYPKNPEDGILIFDGRAELYIDADVTPEQIYYYSLFVFDSFGNVSLEASNMVLVPLGEEVVKQEETLRRDPPSREADDEVEETFRQDPPSREASEGHSQDQPTSAKTMADKPAVDDDEAFEEEIPAKHPTLQEEIVPLEEEGDKEPKEISLRGFLIQKISQRFNEFVERVEKMSPSIKKQLEEVESDEEPVMQIVKKQKKKKK